MTPVDVLVVSGTIGAVLVAAGAVLTKPRPVPVRVRHDDEDQR
jgi:hypothetical protein